MAEDPGFNAAIRSYFLRLADQEPSRVAWLVPRWSQQNWHD
jgi:hypothetical protein